MTANEGFIWGLCAGLGFGLSLVPALYFVVVQPCRRFIRGWRLRVQTADAFEQLVRQEIDRRWLSLEAERRLRIATLEVQEHMTREGAATRKNP